MTVIIRQRDYVHTRTFERIPELEFTLTLIARLYFYNNKSERKSELELTQIKILTDLAKSSKIIYTFFGTERKTEQKKNQYR